MPRELFEDLDRKESDLSLVIIAIIVKPIAANPVTSDAFDLTNFQQRIIIRLAAMMAKVVVSGR